MPDFKIYADLKLQVVGRDPSKLYVCIDGKSIKVAEHPGPRIDLNANATSALRESIVNHFTQVPHAEDRQKRMALKARATRYAEALVGDLRKCDPGSLTYARFEQLALVVQGVARTPQALDAAIEQLSAPSSSAPPPEAKQGRENLEKAMQSLRQANRAKQVASEFTFAIARLQASLFSAICFEGNSDPRFGSPQIVDVGVLSPDRLKQILADLERQGPGEGFMHISLVKALRETTDPAVVESLLDYVNGLIERISWDTVFDTTMTVGPISAALILSLNPEALRKVFLTPAQCDDLFRSCFMLLGRVNLQAGSGRAQAEQRNDTIDYDERQTTNMLAAQARQFMASEQGYAVAQRLARALAILQHNAERLDRFAQSRDASNPAFEGTPLLELLDRHVPAAFDSLVPVRFPTVESPLALTWQTDAPAPEAVEVPVSVHLRSQVPPVVSTEQARGETKQAAGAGQQAPSKPTAAQVHAAFSEGASQRRRPNAQPGAKVPGPAKHHHPRQINDRLSNANAQSRADSRKAIQLGVYGKLKTWGIDLKAALDIMRAERVERSGSQRLVQPPSLDSRRDNRRPA